ncbi:hypothetical protein BH23PLA1_BH23PLA1_40290 [soil metagenome]
MVNCAYCEGPLVCDDCQADYQPPDPEAYRALSWTESSLNCPSCGALLVCHWCKTPYDGTTEAGEETRGV